MLIWNKFMNELVKWNHRKNSGEEAEKTTNGSASKC